MLGPSIVGAASAGVAASRGFQVSVGLALAASFPLELASDRAGLLLRAGACIASIVVACPPGAARTRAGFHRGLFRFALYFVPVGLLVAGIVPERRVAFLHLTFIAGLYLLVVAVTAHVIMLHSGREDLASRRPWPIAAAAIFAVAATIVRVFADRFWQQYFALLAVAGLLWLMSATVWMIFVVGLMRRPPG